MHQVDQTTEQMVRSVWRTRRTGCGWIPSHSTRDPGRRPISTRCSMVSSGTAAGRLTKLGIYSSVIAPSIISADSPRFLGFIPAAPTKASCCSTC